MTHPAPPPAQALSNHVPPPPPSWTKYQYDEGRLWWSKADGKTFFFEDDDNSGWQLFQDEASMRIWYCHVNNEDWFFVDSGSKE